MTFLRTAALVLSLNLLGHAQPAATVSDAWAAVADGLVAVYATINNPSMYDVYVTSGTSEAGKVEFVAGGKTVANLTVPAYGAAELKPGETFVRVTELKNVPKAGDEIKLTLTTDGGVALAIAAVVK